MLAFLPCLGYLVVIIIPLFSPVETMENTENEQGRRYRKVIVNLPEHVAWKIEKRIGGGNINSLAKIFLCAFGNGKAGLDFSFDLNSSDVQKILRDLGKGEQKKAA